MTAALGYYRAAFRRPAWLAREWRRSVSTPTLQIWGLSDRYLGVELARRVTEHAPAARTVYLDASHWVHEELPDEAGSLLIDFIRATDDTTGDQGARIGTVRQ